MSESSFYEDRAKLETRAAVADIEARTSAEVVVAIRRAAGHYRDANYLVGFLFGLVALLVMLFADYTFGLGTFPVGVLAGFVAGALVSSQIAPVRRIFSLPSHKRAQARSAARVAFVDLGISRTRGRTGILVYVALFERQVEVVCDVGVDPDLLGDDWNRAVAALRASLQPRPGLDRFIAALRALGPSLAAAMPRADDDVNELPDDVAADDVAPAAAASAGAASGEGAAQ